MWTTDTMLTVTGQWSMQAIKLPVVTLLEFSDWLGDIGRATSLLHNPTVKQERFQSGKPETVLTFVHKKGFSKFGGCVVCSEWQHQLTSCATFENMAVNDIWNAVTQNKLCISSSNPNHRVNDCSNEKKCTVDGCVLKHHNLLHKTNRSEVRGKTLGQQRVRENIQQESVHIHRINSDDIVLRTLPVIMKGL
ncbi:hypothetical protein JTB14_021816 [Gonioctena quinquepunctata]|nr:hypothetical protein JTB14_021816 [Gonioctena quinquepunctata]